MQYNSEQKKMNLIVTVYPTSSDTWQDDGYMNI